MGQLRVNESFSDLQRNARGIDHRNVVALFPQAENLDNALANLKEALELYFEDVPQPVTLETPVIAPVEVNP